MIRTVSDNGLAVVGICVSSDLFFVNMALGKKLKQHHGSRIILYVPDKQSQRKHEKFVREECVDEIIIDDALYAGAVHEELNESEVFDRAQELERFLGCTYNQLVMCRRDFGHGFSLGGLYHPQSYCSAKVNYVQTVHAFSEAVCFWKREIERRGLTLIVNGPKEAAVVARAMGIHFRQLTSARHANRYFWARQEYGENQGIVSAYNALSGRTFPLVKKESSYLTDMQQRQKFFASHSLVGLLRKATTYLVAHAIRKVLVPESAPKAYYPSSVLQFCWRVYQDTRRMRPPLTRSLESLKGHRFVYYPLHTEPESTLHVMSPECFQQLAVIASLARDLPAGVLLGVKETVYGVGRRPREFYRQIVDFKNVVLLDISETGLNAVKQADAVATICGTGGLEAAILGKPVVVFGRHTDYAFLPHVFPVFREEDLAGALHQALSSGLDQNRAREDGARFVEAIVRTTFDMKGFTNLDPTRFDDDVIAAMAAALATSVKAPDGPQIEAVML